MKISRTVLIVILFYLLPNNSIYMTTIEEIFTCTNETECDELAESEVYGNTNKPDNALDDILSTTTESMNDIDNSTTSAYSTQSTKIQIVPTTSVLPKITIHNNETRNFTIHKVQSDVCECDLTISSCDINCCCDQDCNEFHLTTFSHCEDNHAELYDSRYCYNTNFIDRNNTPFILEKLASNLFCILYDNLPPTYSIINDLDIKTEEDLQNAIKPYKLNWHWEGKADVPEPKLSNPYQDGDAIFKLYENYIQPLELLQSGFTGLCTFKKTLKYLHGWKDRCLQTELTNSNNYLFPTAFSNFSIIISPNLLNSTSIKLTNQTCPRSICLPVINNYCQNSWKQCNTTNISGSCSNGTCQNVVRGVKYLIVHNGSMGINHFNAYYNIGNVSDNFYQYFEVTFEWVNLNKNKSFALSGNPGYIFGKPVIIGALKINKTDSIEIRYVSFNKSDSFLTLPIAQKNGECNKIDRYTVTFGEDVKLRCSVSLHVNNFSTYSCVQLQNHTMNFMVKDSLYNINHTNQYRLHVSKSGNITKNETSNWVQVLLDRVPQNVVTGQQINERLHCSGLISSIHLNILYTTLPKPETLTNYNILGVGIKFSNESDVSWPKCQTENCTDILKLDVITYVTFHDISRPSKYYFVGGPNLDISLPYDFFFPFLSSSEYIQPNIFLMCCMIFNVFCTALFNNIV